jgi:hypothetical protein
VHATAEPPWYTLKVRPATVSDAVREAVLEFALTAQMTVPLPVPLVGEHVNQLALLDAVQSQPLPHDTVIALSPGSELRDAEVG